MIDGVAAVDLGQGRDQEGPEGEAEDEDGEDEGGGGGGVVVELGLDIRHAGRENRRGERSRGSAVC